MKTRKQTRKNRILSLLLTLVMLLPMIPVVGLSVTTVVTADDPAPTETLLSTNFESETVGTYGMTMTYTPRFYFRVKLVKVSDSSELNPGINYNNFYTFYLWFTAAEIAASSDAMKAYVAGIASGTYNVNGSVASPFQLDTGSVSLKINADGTPNSSAAAVDYYRYVTYTYGWFNYGAESGSKTDVSALASTLGASYSPRVYRIIAEDESRYLHIPFEGHSMTSSGAPMFQSGNCDKRFQFAHRAISNTTDDYLVVETKIRYSTEKASFIDLGFFTANINGAGNKSEFLLCRIHPDEGRITTARAAGTNKGGIVLRQGAWNTIRVVMNMDAGTYKVYVNGSLYDGNCVFNTNQGGENRITGSNPFSSASIVKDSLYLKMARASDAGKGSKTEAGVGTMQNGNFLTYVANNLIGIDFDDVKIEAYASEPGGGEVVSDPRSAYSALPAGDSEYYTVSGGTNPYIRIPLVGSNTEYIGNFDRSLQLAHSAYSYDTARYVKFSGEMRYHSNGDAVNDWASFEIQFRSLGSSQGGKTYIDVCQFAFYNGNFYRESDGTRTLVAQGTYFDADEWFDLEIVFDLMTGYFWIYANGVRVDSITANAASNTNAHNRLYKDEYLSNISFSANQLYIAKCNKNKSYNLYDSSKDINYVDWRNVKMEQFGSSRLQYLADFSQDAGKSGTGRYSKDTLTGLVSHNTHTPHVYTIEDGYLKVPMALGDIDTGSNGDSAPNAVANNSPIDVLTKLDAPEMSYANYPELSMEVRYYFPVGLKGYFETQFHEYKYAASEGGANTDAWFLNLFEIRCTGGTTGSFYKGSTMATFTLGEWHTFRVVVTMATGKADYYLDGTKVGTAKSLGNTYLTLKAGGWSFGKVMKLSSAGIKVNAWKAANYKNGEPSLYYLIDDARLWAGDQEDANVTVCDWDGNVLIPTTTAPTGFYETPAGGKAVTQMKVYSEHSHYTQNYPGGSKGITLTDDAIIYIRGTIGTEATDAYSPISTATDGVITLSGWQGSPAYSILSGGSGIGGALTDGYYHQALVTANRDKGFVLNSSTVSKGQYLITQTDLMFDADTVSGIFSVRLGDITLDAESSITRAFNQTTKVEFDPPTDPTGLSYAYLFFVTIDETGGKIGYHGPESSSHDPQHRCGEHTLEGGTWYRIVSVVDTVNGTNRVYVNGELDNPFASLQTIEGQTQAYSVDANRDGYSDWILVDGVKNFSVNANTIQFLQQQSTGTDDNGTKGINLDNIVTGVADDCYVLNGECVVNNSAPDFTACTPSGKTRLFTSALSPAGVTTTLTTDSTATYDGYDFRVYNIGFELLYGCSIRLSNPSGLRYMTTIDKADVEALNNFMSYYPDLLTGVSVGTVITPTEYVGYIYDAYGSYDNFTMAGLEDYFDDDPGTGEENLDYINVRAGFNNWLDEWTDDYVFAGSIVNIHDTTMNFSGRSYFTYTVNGSETILYSNYSVAANSRNVKWVAEQALGDPNYGGAAQYSGKLPAEQLATLNALAGIS